MRYQVIVGNVGTVYDGDKIGLAIARYIEYVESSVLCIGRAGGEPVTLMIDGEIEREYIPIDASETLEE